MRLAGRRREGRGARPGRRPPRPATGLPSCGRGSATGRYGVAHAGTATSSAWRVRRAPPVQLRPRGGAPRPGRAAGGGAGGASASASGATATSPSTSRRGPSPPPGRACSRSTTSRSTCRSAGRTTRRPCRSRTTGAGSGGPTSTTGSSSPLAGSSRRPPGPPPTLQLDVRWRNHHRTSKASHASNAPGWLTGSPFAVRCGDGLPRGWPPTPQRRARAAPARGRAHSAVMARRRTRSS